MEENGKNGNIPAIFLLQQPNISTKTFTSINKLLLFVYYIICSVYDLIIHLLQYFHITICGKFSDHYTKSIAIDAVITIIFLNMLTI